MTYLTKLKTLLTEAVKTTFDAEYPVADFRNIHTSIEFPMKQQDYPGIWVDYMPIGSLQNVGIGHVEYATPADDGSSRAMNRWRFQGEASFTVVALTSLQRDRLHDEMVRTLAFGAERRETNQFRRYIEDNEFLAVNFDFDEITTRGFASSLGTPWQTEDMVYEAEVVMECFGEFLSDALTGTLLPVSAVEFYPYPESHPDEARWIQ